MAHRCILSGHQGDQDTAPWHPEPLPAVQPKQWLSTATERPVSSSRLSMSHTVLHPTGDGDADLRRLGGGHLDDGRGGLKT